MNQAMPVLDHPKHPAPPQSTDRNCQLQTWHNSAKLTTSRYRLLAYLLPSRYVVKCLFRNFDVKYRFSRGKTHGREWQKTSLSLQSIEDAQVVNTVPNWLSAYGPRAGGYHLRQNRNGCFLGAVPSIVVRTPCQGLDAPLRLIGDCPSTGAATCDRRTSFSFLSVRRCDCTSRNTLRRNC